MTVLRILHLWLEIYMADTGELFSMFKVDMSRVENGC